jgi:putative Mn2+ efflux pump MntP
MAKSNYKIKGYEFLVLAVISFLLSAAVAFRWFSEMIGDRSYSELGSTRTSGIAYAISILEASNWRFVLVILLLILGYEFIREGLKKKKS